MTTLTAPLLPFTPAQVGRLTLEQRLETTWDELGAHGAADCPVCGERMEMAETAASCGGCGSHLR
jgi:hypothetical protein